MGWTAVSDWKRLVSFIIERGGKESFPVSLLESALLARGNIIRHETKERTINALKNIGYIKEISPGVLQFTPEGIAKSDSNG